MWKGYDDGRRLIMIVEEYDDDGKSRTMDTIWDGEGSEKEGGEMLVMW